MDKNSVKLELMQQLMLTESEEVLLEVRKLLARENQSFSLTTAHKTILDERKAKHEAGEGKTYSWDEAKQKIRSGK